MRPSPTILTHALLLLATLLIPPAPAQTLARTSIPLFPLTCLRIQATPLDAPPPDLQAALNACPPNTAVELTPSADTLNTTFLLPPITLPPAVTLLIDPGVTAYATGTLTAAPDSALMGFGILDFKIPDARNLPTPLIEAQGPFNIFKLTLRNLPPTAAPRLQDNTLAPKLSADLFLTTPTTPPSIDLIGPGPYTLTAVVIPPDPTLATPDALVFFYDGPTQLGSAPIANTLAQLTLPTLAPGPHHLTAFYPAANLPFGSVGVLVPAITLSATATTAYSRTPVTFTATLFDPSATGSITFLDGATSLNQSTLANGAASFTTSTLALGQHSISAAYSGDAANAPTTSPTLAVQINANPTITALAPIPSGDPYGTPLSLTASLLPTDATGSIFFRDTSTNTPLGQAPLVNGTATLANITNLSVGTHTITATYPGDVDDLLSTSSPQITTINAIPTTTNLTVNPTTSTYGTPITLTTSVTSGSTGSVTVATTISGQITTIPLTNSAATYTISPPLSPGTYTLTATYSGDQTHAPSLSSAISTQINPAPTTLTLTNLPATMQSNAQPTLTATLSPTTATGQITFTDNNLGPLAPATLTNGIATIKLPILLPGPHTLTATYPGDTNNAPSTSPALTTQVTPNSPTIALTAPASITFGQTPTLTASISPSTATGLISLTDNNLASLGSALLANGAASLKLPIFPPGIHTLTATFPGDPYNNAATSPPTPLTIFPAPTITLLTLAQPTVPARTPVVFNIQVSSTPAAVQTGQITLRAQSPNGPITLSTAALANASAGQAFATIILDSTALGLGVFTSVTAAYAGDTDDAPSISTPLTFTIAPTPVTATLTLSALQIPAATTITLTARISSEAATPTGTITFYKDRTAVATVPLTNGLATTILPPQAIGNYLLTATYNPTNLFAAITTDPTLLTVIPPFTLTLAPSILTLPPASSGDSTLTITPLLGFNGPIGASCTTPFPYITCKIDIPAAIIADTPAVGTVHITIARDITLTALLLPILLPLGRKLRTPLRALQLLALMLVITATLTSCAPGTFFEIPSGPNIIPITVTTSTSPATTFLKVVIVNKRLQ